MLAKDDKDGQIEFLRGTLQKIVQELSYRWGDVDYFRQTMDKVVDLSEKALMETTF